MLIREAKEYERKLDAGELPPAKILISPKRLGAETGMPDFKLEKLYPQEIVTLVRTEDDFAVKEGMEIVKAAARAGMPFVQAKL